MRDEAKTGWLFSGPDVASSYLKKTKQNPCHTSITNPYLGTGVTDNNC